MPRMLVKKQPQPQSRSARRCPLKERQLQTPEAPDSARAEWQQGLLLPSGEREQQALESRGLDCTVRPFI